MVKTVLSSIKATDKQGIISELLSRPEYRGNIGAFYKFFGVQGGTVHQLAEYVLLWQSKKWIQA
jgi:hypothetical protein